MLWKILKIIAAAATILTGLISVIWPAKVSGFTGLEPRGGRGITEIRTILGALFVGLGAAVLYFNRPEPYAVLGITYLAMAAVRGISIVVDRAPETSNLISLIVELLLGIILII